MLHRTQICLHTAWSTKEPNTTFYEAKLTTSSGNFVVTLKVFFTQSYNEVKKIMKCIIFKKCYTSPNNEKDKTGKKLELP